MWLFRVARAWIIVGHGVAFTFSLGLARLYWFILTSPVVQLSLTQLSADIEQFLVPTFVCAISLSVGHAGLLVHVCASYLRSAHREVVPLTVMPSIDVKPAIQQQQSTENIQLFPVPLWKRVYTWIRRQTSRAWTAWKKYNAEIARAFMIWEVAAQTYQANKMSHLVVSKGINRVVALVIVTNCWFSPVLHSLLRKRSKAQVRLLRLLIDSWLDVVFAMVIPIIVFDPYYRAYDGSLSLVPTLYYYLDTWYTNAIHELRQVIVSSWLDLVSKMTGGFALWYRLYVVWKALLVAIAEQERLEAARSTRRLSRGLAFSSSLFRSIHNPSRVTKMLDRVLVFWGIAVLSLHLYATLSSLQHPQSGCLLELHPWGSTSYTCAVLEVSCPQRGTQGERIAIQRAIESVDPYSVQVLIISHCPELDVPPTIQALTNLMMLKIYNATIKNWDHDAALREIFHPMLSVVFLPRVNMTQLPVGLTASDFPSRVWDIEFHTSNLTDFPDSIIQSWRNVRFFLIEANPLLTEIPSAVLQLPSMDSLIITGDGIQSIPDDGLETKALFVLFADGNPLQQLPHAVGSLRQLEILSFVGTNISEIPMAWFHKSAHCTTGGRRVIVDATASPLCEKRLRLEASGPDSAESLPDWLVLLCTEGKPSIQYTYPIELEDQWRSRSDHY